jgi:hypothetical protein
MRRLSPVRNEEKYVNFIDCAFSDFFVGWRGLGLFPLARIARTPLICPENMRHVLCQAFTPWNKPQIKHDGACFRANSSRTKNRYLLSADPGGSDQIS